MMTFQDQYTRGTDITGANETADTTLMKAFINESVDIIHAFNNYRWPFLEDLQDLDDTSTAGTISYELPEDFGQFIAFRFEVGTNEIYRPDLVEDYDLWQYYQSLASSNSDAIQKVYIRDDKIELWPAPASSGKIMQLRYYRKGRDMTEDNYATGTIVTTTNGGTGIVGTGSPNWDGGLSPEATLWLRITKVASDAAKSGDGKWYKISSIADDTNLVLVKKYQGATIASGTAAYVIGEMPELPKAHHNLPLWRALAMYYDQSPDPQLSRTYWMRYDGGYEAGLSQRVGGALKRLFDSAGGTGASMYIRPRSAQRDVLDVNLFPRGINQGGVWT